MDFVLKTDRLILRPLDISDLETAHIYASDLENTTYMMRLPNDTKEETAQFLTRVTDEWRKENPNFYEFAIDQLKVQKLYANCDCRNRDSYKLMERMGLVLERSNGTRTYPKTLETAGELTYSLTVNEMGEQK